MELRVYFKFLPPVVRCARDARTHGTVSESDPFEKKVTHHVLQRRSLAKIFHQVKVQIQDDRSANFRIPAVGMCLVTG